jgi:hypothetical protein
MSNVHNYKVIVRYDNNVEIQRIDQETWGKNTRSMVDSCVRIMTAELTDQNIDTFSIEVSYDD